MVYIFTRWKLMRRMTDDIRVNVHPLLQLCDIDEEEELCWQGLAAIILVWSGRFKISSTLSFSVFNSNTIPVWDHIDNNRQ